MRALEHLLRCRVEEAFALRLAQITDRYGVARKDDLLRHHLNLARPRIDLPCDAAPTSRQAGSMGLDRHTVVV
jgi:hypothetical protein